VVAGRLCAQRERSRHEAVPIDRLDNVIGRAVGCSHSRDDLCQARGLARAEAAGGAAGRIRFAPLLNQKVDFGGLEAGELDLEFQFDQDCSSMAKMLRSQPAFSASRLSAMT
jgi:hypothetical protein